MGALFWIFIYLAISAVAGQQAVTCLEGQIRSHGDPTNDTISRALYKVLYTPKTGPCSGLFPDLPGGAVSNVAQWSDGPLILEVTRASANTRTDQHCFKAFESIVFKCISHGNYWGGNMTSTTFNYAIYNKDFPKDRNPQALVTSLSGSLHHKPTLYRSHHVIYSSPHSPRKGSDTPTLSTQAAASSVPSPIRISSKKTGPVKIPHPQDSSQPVVKLTSGNSRPITKAPIKVSSTVDYRTQTLSGITGRPYSYSQTKTTDDKGRATIAPIWFDSLGAAIVVTALGFSGAKGAVAPLPLPLSPPGLPPLSIGPDGLASRVGSQSQQVQDLRTGSQSQQHTPIPRSSSTGRVSSFSSQSRASSGSSTAIRPTSTSTAKYLIYPKNGKDPANGNFTSELTKVHGTDLRVFENPISGIYFWSAYLDTAELARYRSNPLVFKIQPNEVLTFQDVGIAGTPSPAATGNAESVHSKRNPEDKAPGSNSAVLRHRDAQTWHQTYAPPDLVMISTPPPGKSMRSQDYVYDGTAGRGVTVYVIDTGMDTENPEFASMVGTRTWLFPDDISPEFHYPDTKDDFNGHGTCVASKIVGERYGVAKDADLVMVKWPVTLANTVDYSEEAILATMNIIAQHINPLKKNVVSLSFGLFERPKQEADLFIQHYKRLFSGMIEFDSVTFVIAAGNNGRNPQTKTINSYPALFSDELPIIVVGAVDLKGITSDFSQGGPRLTVSSPAENVFCADNVGNGVQLASGTSLAAPAVAGLAAYFLALDKYKSAFNVTNPSDIPRNMIKLINSLAYIRPGGTEPVIFNGEFWTSSCSTRRAKRGLCSTAPTSTSAISAAPKPTPTLASSPLSASVMPSSPAPTKVNSYANQTACTPPSGDGTDPCQLAYEYFRDALYTAAQSYFAPASDSLAAITSDSPLAGCTASFSCESPAAYKKGMTADQIRAAFDNLFIGNSNLNSCGSGFLSNGCYVAINGCPGCVPIIPLENDTVILY